MSSLPDSSVSPCPQALPLCSAVDTTGGEGKNRWGGVGRLHPAVWVQLGPAGLLARARMAITGCKGPKWVFLFFCCCLFFQPFTNGETSNKRRAAVCPALLSTQQSGASERGGGLLAHVWACSCHRTAGPAPRLLQKLGRRCCVQLLLHLGPQDTVRGETAPASAQLTIPCRQEVAVRTKCQHSYADFRVCSVGNRFQCL